MILGSTLANEANLPSDIGAKFVFFPLIVHAMDIVVSSIGIAFVGGKAHGDDTSNPMTQLQRGYRVALGLSVLGFYFITGWLLEDPSSPGSSFKVGGKLLSIGIRLNLLFSRLLLHTVLLLWIGWNGLCLYHRTKYTVLYRLPVSSSTKHCGSQYHWPWN